MPPNQVLGGATPPPTPQQQRDKRKRDTRPPIITQAAPGLAAATATPEQRPAPSPAAPPPRQAAPPPARITGPPIKSMTRYGYFGSIHEVNQRTDVIVSAYQQLFGHKPSPGLVFDVLRSDVADEDVPKLFSAVPRSGRAAAAAGLVNTPQDTLDYSPNGLLKGRNLLRTELDQQVDSVTHPGAGQLLSLMRDAYASHQQADFFDNYGGDVQKLITDFPQARNAAVRALYQGLQRYSAQQAHEQAFRVRRAGVYHDLEEQVAAGKISRPAMHAKLQEMGFIPGFKAAEFDKVTLATPFAQVAVALASSPFGMYALAQGAKDDGAAAASGDFSFKHTRAAGAQMAHQVGQDIRHPVANSGFLFLDVLGVATPMVRGATLFSPRLAAATGRLGAEEDGLLTGRIADRVRATRAARTRAIGPTQEEFELSINPIIALIQGFQWNRREAALQASRDDTGASGLFADQSGPFSRAVRRHLSTESKIGRKAAQRRDVEMAVMMQPVRDIQEAVSWSSRAGSVFSRLGRQPSKIVSEAYRKKARLQPKLLEDVGIFILSIDDPAPFQVWRDFHNRMVEYGIGDAKAHKAMVALGDKAERLVEKPSFQPLYNAVRAAVDAQEVMKVERLGLAEPTAARRVARVGALMRGEKIRQESLGLSIDARLKSLDDKIAAFSTGRKQLSEASASRLGQLQAARSKFDELRQAVNAGASPAALRAKARDLGFLAESDTVETLTQREAELSKRWEKAIQDKMIEYRGKGGELKSRQDELNRMAKRTKRGGRYIDKTPAAESLHAYAEGELLDALKKDARSDPEARKMLANLAELDLIRLKIQTLKGEQRAASGGFEIDPDIAEAAAKPPPPELANLEHGLAEGKFVRALDRDNVGRVLYYNPETDVAEVLFFNKATKRMAVKEMKGHMLRTISKREVHRNNALHQLTVEKDPTGLIDALRLPVVIEPLELTQVSPDSFYVKLEPLGKQKAGPTPDSSGRPFAPGMGPYGISVPKMDATLTHEMTGKAIIAGDHRVDASKLTAESYGKTVRAVTLVDDYSKYLKASVARRPSGPDRMFYKPIREKTEVAPNLRRVLERLESNTFDARDAAGMSEETVDAIRTTLFPDETTLKPDDKIRWVDERLLGDLHRRPYETPMFISGLKAIGDLVNEPFRIGTLFLRLAYILNAAGNAFMNVFHGSFHQLGKAATAKSLYGVKVRDTLDALMGESKTLSYTVDEGSVLTKTSRGFAQLWSHVADTLFRRAALIHELHLRGLNTREKLEAALFSPDGVDPLIVEAANRANRAMVDFRGLTWAEKNIARHLIFVYPWVSRATAWSFRTALDHPTKTMVLAQLGRDAENKLDEFLSKLTAVPGIHAPEWFVLRGYVPIANKLIATNTINSFTTAAEVTGAVESTYGNGDGYSTIRDLFGPIGELLVNMVTRKDSNDRTLAHPFTDTLLQIFEGLPQLHHPKKGPAPKPLDLSSRDALLKQLNEAAHRSTFVQDFWSSSFGPFSLAGLVTGAVTPKTLDPQTFLGDYYKAASLEQRSKIEVQMIRGAVKLQAGLLGRTPPPEVGKSIDLIEKIDLERGKEQDALGRNLTAAERLETAIRVLRKEGRLSAGDVADWKGRIAKTPAGELRALSTSLMKTAGYGAALSDWDSDVRFVLDQATPAKIAESVSVLQTAGLLPGGAAGITRAPLNTRLDYARRMLAFTRDAAAMRAEYDQFGQLRADQAVKRTEYRQWLEQNDQPVVVDGQTFPSPARMAWADQTQNERDDQTRRLATVPWRFLSGMEKEMLGWKPTPGVASGWVAYETAIRDWKAKEIRAGASGRVSTDTRVRLAKVIGRQVPGFYPDFLQDRKPLYQRLQTMPQFSRDPAWKELFAAANTVYVAAGNAKVSKTTMQNKWGVLLQDVIYPYVEQHPDFKAKLDAYDPHLLEDFLR